MSLSYKMTDQAYDGVLTQLTIQYMSVIRDNK